MVGIRTIKNFSGANYFIGGCSAEGVQTKKRGLKRKNGGLFV
jgi:hypothetical protein